VRFIVLVVEGEVCELCFFEAYKDFFVGQTVTKFEIVTISTKGNQGHQHFFEVANKTIEEVRRDPDSYLSLCEDKDSIEKWAICDYDKMEKHGISLQEFSDLASYYDYNLVINKPNFEFFILALLIGVDKTYKIKPKDYEKEINCAVDALNDSCHLGLTHYSKHEKPCQAFFFNLIFRKPSLIRSFSLDRQKAIIFEEYTQMSMLLRRLDELNELP